MSLLDRFICAYKKEYLKQAPLFDKTLEGLLKQFKHVLLDDKLSPSIPLRQAVSNLEARLKEPMKVAVTGQFSSGKSTFLNALLAKNILPTGITPVTSKVNYIRYGDELKIRVKYKDGRDEYHDIDAISKFTDQRENVEDIDYLTLYSPLNLLRDIVFVDTPGLNSQAASDTQTTVKVLKEVDGIIWLTLIDNAGKMSETRILRKYLNEYKNKSLCVLNQKDKFTEDEVEETLRYVKETFKEFFSEVIAISAKQALKSRSSDKEVLMYEALEEFLDSLHVKLKEDIQNDNKFYIEEEYKKYRNRIDNILNMDLSQNLKLAKESNIAKVLEFIKLDIQPQAASSKEYSIKKEMKNICDIISSQYRLFLDIYNELIERIEEFDKVSTTEFLRLKDEFSKELKESYQNIENIIDTIANEIYNNIKTVKKSRYVIGKKGIIRKTILYKKVDYEVSYIDSDNIHKKLFWDDDLIGKMFKKYNRELKDIEFRVNEKNKRVYENFEKEMNKWQNPYSIIRKKDEIHSDIEFANIRKFAARVYEHILKPYHDEILNSYALISSEFNMILGAVKFNYENATEVCISFLNDKIKESIELYESNPAKFTLYTPPLQEIKERLYVAFHMYELDNLMNANRTFLSKDYERLIHNFQNIRDLKISFIENRKIRHEKILQTLISCKKSIG